VTRMLAVLVGALLLAACGSTRTQADQDKDGKTLANALRAAYSEGSSFKLDHQLLITGGDIPSGKAFPVHATVANGALKDDTARFTYRLQRGQQVNTYDMLIAQGQLFLREHGSSGWKTTALTATTTFYPSLRLDLVRETVLLARSVSSGSVAHIDAGFARKYVVRPAPDQLEQLESMTVQGAAEEAFLKTATAELDVYLLVPSNKLGRIELHMTGIDPSSGEKQQILSTLDVKPAKVGAITPPADAQQVTPSNLLG
jgi:hypothetical protein